MKRWTKRLCYHSSQSKIDDLKKGGDGGGRAWVKEKELNKNAGHMVRLFSEKRDLLHTTLKEANPRSIVL